MDTLPDAHSARDRVRLPAAFSPGITSAGNANGSENTENITRVKVHDPPKFDLESYIANYTGRTRFDRLYLIGTTSTVLSVEALKSAIIEAKSGKDVANYEKAVRALAEVAPNEESATLDSAWVQNVQRTVRTQDDRLDQELRGYKNNLIKESIRMGNEDIGNHYYETGDLVAASKAYSRMRDYCTTPNHIASMLFKLINVSVERGDWLNVQSNVHRLRNAQSKPDDQIKNQPKMSAALGLAQMHSSSYLDAANSFLSTDPSLGDSFNEIITPNDVAVYGGLCALASMNRVELQLRVLDNSSFRNFLELEPHIRRAIGFFCNSKFRPCLDILDAYRTDYLLDIHLRRHVSDLYNQIRTKAIKQYLVPFSRVTLDSMAAIFAPAVVGGEAQPTGVDSPFVQELIQLIQKGVLDARIDLEKSVLVSNQTDLRMEVQEKTLESLRSFNEEAHMRIFRASVLQAGLEVKASGAERRQRVDSADARGTGSTDKFGRGPGPRG
ncbi:COP9 signalosome subunit 1 (CsnA) [Penicillium macrosclerotiorum]|uniref:COP9 signalosome subunit 1 (CsnA) n=1 Tax=Penicillium macrosclerotiorum TaxID=303699 RepID=UPI002546B30A|nr:COP9 signalosome subunit 1 (CsnA) [Penicillium macrosclerotiorum]KAJ5664693.1 COP9 signalosome subunit 1 (CsnA) [Penicillium macrosclerotiorum]